MKERLLFVDNLRALLIMAVVLGHCLQYTGCDVSGNILYNAIQSFQMPLFMFVSGFVSFRDSYSWSWLIKRCKRLLIPYAVGTFIMSLTLREGSVLEYFVYPLKGLWFLWVLAVLSFMQYFTAFLNSKLRGDKKGFFACLVLVFTIATVLSIVLKGILCFDLVAFHFLFYFCGYYFCQFWSTIKKTPFPVLFLLFILSVLLSLSFNKKIPNYFLIRNYSVYIRVVSIIISISFFMMSSVCLDKQYGLLSFIGINTLGIYVVHRVLFEYRPGFLESAFIDKYYSISVLVLFILVMGFSLLLVCFFSRNKLLKLLFLGR